MNLRVFFSNIKSYSRTIRRYFKRRYLENKLVREIKLFHNKKIEYIKIQSRLRKLKIVFIVDVVSSWKSEDIFIELLAHCRFEPSVLIVPLVGRNEISENELIKSISYVRKKTYPYHVFCKGKSKKSIASIDEIRPDVIFYSNPHRISFDAVYSKAFKNILSCYIPYSHQVSKYDNYRAQYNQEFHNWMWKIFVPHHEDLIIFKNHSISQGRNVIVTGYPSCEKLWAGLASSQDTNKINSKYHFIWAPHHTIDYKDLPLSNFLRLADEMKNLVLKYRDMVKWTFRPHPFLKQALISNETWGLTRTVNYYNWWKDGETTSLSEGNYEELFFDSDAMIHDCGSFLAEYLYVDKPVMFIWSSENITSYFNPFGLKALDACEKGSSINDIEAFILRFISNNDIKKKERNNFRRNELNPLMKLSPKQKIVSTLEKYLLI